MRDNLKSKAFLDELIAENNTGIKKLSDLLDKSPDASIEDKMRWAFAKNMEYQEKIVAMYTRGDVIADINIVYLEFLDDFWALVDIAHKDIGYVKENYAYSLDKYYRIMAWAILFNVDLERRKEFVEDLDFFGQQKPGDIMLSKAGLIDRQSVDRLGGKSAFEPLLQALETENSGQQEVAISQFLKNWYPTLRKMNVAWIDNHKSKHDTYFGYWCFEAAAAVKVLGLDPDVFKNTPYFPYDLVSRS
ncbi:DUF1911 domain-containing protein [Phyllobacterium sp. 628]|uniref:PoNe immunity protein domain-containing protein n=1 Tax=Phyllobacterium sp. 628 TaxID=2718938 RepID=UPI0016623C62|nr:PoNe immunity protein domain-containing protein [Phyllobacterium sp. 628]QND51891.1 DUF1911 domain-containing protein [Phyllobacterium sp. 628]